MNVHDEYTAVRTRINQVIIIVCIYQLLTITFASSVLFNISSGIALLSLLVQSINVFVYAMSKPLYGVMHARITSLIDYLSKYSKRLSAYYPSGRRAR